MKHFFLVALIATIMVGCSGGKNTNYEALVATPWTLSEIISSDSASVELPAEEVYILFYDSSAVSGFAGCNTFFGDYQTSEQDLITIDLKGRSMALCHNIMFEDQLIEMLGLCSSYTASADELELNDAETGITLLFKPKK